MMKTNRTYGVYVANKNIAGRIGTGSKAEMFALFESVKNDHQYDCVALIKWNTRYNCWYDVEKIIR